EVIKLDNKIGKGRTALSVLLTISILTVLTIVGPAAAVKLLLHSPSSSTPYVGDQVTFLAEINIETDEVIPIKTVSLEVNGVECEFPVEGGASLTADLACLGFVLDPLTDSSASYMAKLPISEFGFDEYCDFTGWNVGAVSDSVTVLFDGDGFVEPQFGSCMARVADDNGGPANTQPSGRNVIRKYFTPGQNLEFWYNICTYDESPNDHFLYRVETLDGTMIAEFQTAAPWTGGELCTGWQQALIDTSQFMPNKWGYISEKGDGGQLVLTISAGGSKEELNTCSPGEGACIGIPSSCDAYGDSGACSAVGCSWTAGSGSSVTKWSENFASSSDWSGWSSERNGLSYNTNEPSQCINDGNDDCIELDGGDSTEYLAKASDIDLSACDAGTAVFHIARVDNDDSSNDASDCAKVWFSSNSGSSWGSEATIVCDDTNVFAFQTSIPDSYLVSTMRLRIEKEGYTSSSEHGYLDGFSITCDIAAASTCEGSSNVCSTYDNQESSCTTAGCSFLACQEKVTTNESTWAYIDAPEMKLEAFGYGMYGYASHNEDQRAFFGYGYDFEYGYTGGFGYVPYGYKTNYNSELTYLVSWNTGSYSPGLYDFRFFATAENGEHWFQFKTEDTLQIELLEQVPDEPEEPTEPEGGDGGGSGSSGGYSIENLGGGGEKGGGGGGGLYLEPQAMSTDGSGLETEETSMELSGSSHKNADDGVALDVIGDDATGEAAPALTGAAVGATAGFISSMAFWVLLLVVLAGIGLFVVFRNK
ncbi:hypothetical protein ACFL1B_05855, partial [Nanoarchaeota archaeon]